MRVESPDWLRCPPRMVVVAARHAFRELARTEGNRAALVFDSSLDGTARDWSFRRLLFTGDIFDLILTVATTPRGKTLGGELISDTSLTVGIRRPLRATIALPADETGVLAQSVIPAGTACVVVRAATSEAYESNWLTL
jgi:hypothetical protein